MPRKVGENKKEHKINVGKMKGGSRNRDRPNCGCKITLT
jgi:hypothetical protein